MAPYRGMGIPAAGCIMNRLPRDLVQELATLLVKAMQLDQAYNKKPAG